tara:strand:+ start:166 stop:369 length:204 start_codon:yes stop_codon:yes gene_type:complete
MKLVIMKSVLLILFSCGDGSNISVISNQDDQENALTNSALLQDAASKSRENALKRFGSGRFDESSFQ